jgi:hypothetical protein
LTSVSVAAAWRELINKLEFKRGHILLLGIELGTGELSAVFDLKLGSKLGFGLEIVFETDLWIAPGATLSKLGSRLGTELGSRLENMLGSRLGLELDKELGSRLGIELDKELGSRLGIELDKELRVRQLSTVVDINLVSKLGTVLDREHCTVVSNKLGSKLRTVLDREVTENIVNSFGAEIGAVLGFKLGSILGIALGTELGTALGLELGAAKSKMNISVPTGNRRLWHEENMIAFGGPSSL